MIHMDSREVLQGDIRRRHEESKWIKFWMLFIYIVYLYKEAPWRQIIGLRTWGETLL
jgi:hypothetical protein